jgi:hypothetical protein
LTEALTYRSFATKVSQLKISDFSGEMFKDFDVLYTTALQRLVLWTAL